MTAMITDKKAELPDMITELGREARKIGFKMNYNKTKTGYKNTGYNMLNR